MIELYPDSKVSMNVSTSLADKYDRLARDQVGAN